MNTPGTPSGAAETLSRWQEEAFLHLWERVIEQCDERYRESMEAERRATWLDLPPKEQTRARARAALTSLTRSVNTDDEEGAGDELKPQMANLFQSLKDA